MKSRIKILAFSLITACSVPAWAQTETITLRECLKQALEHNQNIAVSRYEEQNVEQQITQARSRALPQVNGNANLTDNFKRQVLVVPGSLLGGSSDAPMTLTVGTTYTTAASVEATTPVFDAAVFTGLKAAKAGRSYAQLGTRQTEEEVINQVAQSYYGILTAREQITVQDSNIVKLNRLVAATQSQYTNGLARKIDLDRIRVNLTNAMTQHTRQVNQVTILTNQLKVLMGIPVETAIALSDIPIRSIEENVDAYTPGNDFNVNDRTEIQVLDAQIHLNELNRKSIVAENYPRLSAFFNYSQNGMSDAFGDMFKKGGGDVWYGMGSFGLRLNVPIFDGFARRSRAKQASIQIQQLQKKREATVLSMNSGFENARAQMISSISSIKAQKENVVLAGEVYNSSQANYNLGLATLTDLLNAQTDYIQAQNSYTQALLDYKNAELESLRSNGKLQTLLQ